MKNLSIKIKITLYFTVAMLLLISIDFTTILFASDVSMVKKYKKQLQNIVESNVNEVKYEDGVLVFEDEFVLHKQGVVVFVYDEIGNLLLGKESKITDYQSIFQQGSVYEIVMEDASYLLYDLPAHIKGWGDIWIRGVTPKNSIVRLSTMNTMVKTSLIAFPVLVLFAAVIGYILTKHLLRPIEKIIDSVEEITEGKDLSKRIGLKKGKDEIYCLANSFDKMFERLEKSFEIEKRFTSDASHELRTPTTVILAQCDYILDGDKTSEEYREALMLIERQGYKMSKLISQLLIFARLEQDPRCENKEEINFSELVNQVCQEQMEISVKGISIISQIESNIFTCVDPVLMARVITNLITNAYQYGKEEGHIWVTLKRDHEEINLVVSDDGIGIKEEELNKIWHRFYRVDPARSTTSSQSMGLGLAMVKQIVELHDGTVNVSSKFGRGSEFVLTFH